MAHGLGILITERVGVAAVSGHAIVGNMHVHPEDKTVTDSLYGVPAETIVQRIVEQVRQLDLKDAPTHIGLGMPGIVRSGFVEDSPNLVQFKGVNMQELVTAAFGQLFGSVPVSIFNDADAMAAGVAAVHGQLHKLIRVWTLGTGIGYGRYPFQDGVWEGGHTVVTLDPREHFCGCGGKGHLEGIMGNRAMRLRFMDLEPEEVFQQAERGEARCVDFAKLWHRALAAGTANSIHMEGPGKFFITGFNARYLNVNLLNEYLHEMVKLSPLQSYQVEVVPGGEEVATIGAAVNAGQAAGIE
jgi:glucokinase